MDQQIVPINGSTATRAIYDKYGGLLYGYILEVVKDSRTAEHYLFAIFKDLPQHLHDVLQPGANTYSKLQQIARKALSSFFETVHDCPATDHVLGRRNRYLSDMTDEQRLIFCNVHYSGKSIDKLAVELNKSEEEVRKILQQAFASIRRAAQ